MYSQYNQFASYYDLYSNVYDYEEWYLYLLSLSHIQNPQGKRCLEIGCGSGGLLLEFMKNGFDVEGLDSSSQMLEYANEKLMKNKKNPTLYLCEAEKFHSKNKYDFIYSANDVINYLEFLSLQKTFLNVSEMLNEGAIFTFDALNLEYFEEENNAQSQDRIILDNVEFCFERQYRRGELYTDIQITDGQKVFNERHRQLLYPKEVIVQSGVQTGFVPLDTYAVFTREKPTEFSSKIQYVFAIK